MSEPWPQHKPTGAEEHWRKKRVQLETVRQKLWATGRVVCSSQMHFDPGTKLGWVSGLAGYSIAELEAELAKRAGSAPRS